jgi:uncharacterized Fe-S radical SAM superfamily protein PflX
MSDKWDRLEHEAKPIIKGVYSEVDPIRIAAYSAQAAAQAAIATADAAREMCDLLREVLTELQAQRRPETHVEHTGTIKVVDLQAETASEMEEEAGLCPCCLEREVVRDGHCVQCAGQEYIPEAEKE